MAALENVGLRVLEVDDIASLVAQPVGPPSGWPHAVRLPADRFDWALRHERDDVVVRPGWVHWACPAEGGASGVIARQTSRQRQRSRGAARHLATLDIQVSEPVDDALLDEWHSVYRAQVRRLPHGLDLMRLLGRRVRQAGSGHALAVWRDGGDLRCGLVFAVDESRSCLIARFAAVTEDARQDELSRAMYLAAADLADLRGLRWVTLGTDVNLTGAMISPGLTSLKLRLGFRPVPADLFGLDSRDIAERLTSVDGLRRPVVRFEYRSPRPPTAGIADFLDGAHALGLVAVLADGDDDAVTRSPVAWRRLEPPR